jgi:hypothetical protein
MPGAGHYRATRHCERGVWGEDDPMSKLDAALEKNEDAWTRVFDAKRDARDRLLKQRQAGEITEYQYLHELCSLSYSAYTQSSGWCSEVHSVTPDGATSDVIVTW